MSIRVIVCDDVPNLRLLFKVVLSRDPEIAVVGEATNGREAIELARTMRPDVVLMDIGMPVMSGLDALPLVRAASPNSRVILLTGFERALIRDVEDAFTLMEKGAPTDQILEMVKQAAMAHAS